MIEIIKELNIEVSKPNVFQAVVAKQYDMNTRFIKATFVDGGNKIYIDPNATVSVVINALRPDGESRGFDGVINDDGTVTVPLHSWMLQLVGTVICDISVIDIGDIETEDDNKKLTTTSFTLLVEQAAYGGEDVTSDPQYDVLVQLLETCNEAGSVAQEALDKSNEALEKSAEADAKYEACVEATENANAVREEIEAGGYIESLKELNEGKKFSFWVGTQAKYDAIEKKQGNTLHLITDDTTEDDINEAIKNLSSSVEQLQNKVAPYNATKLLFEGSFLPTRNVEEIELEDDIAKYNLIAITASKDDNEKITPIFLCKINGAFENEMAAIGNEGDWIEISLIPRENNVLYLNHFRYKLAGDTDYGNAYLHKIIGIC